MPRDYDPNAGAVSGLEGGKGAGKFAGSPEGSGKHAPKPSMETSGSPKPKQGVIVGTPHGIEGTIRKAKDKGMGEAIKRSLGS